MTVNDTNAVICFLVNCQWGEWNQYTKCFTICGVGNQTRSRSKKVTEKYGGKCYGSSTQTKSCYKKTVSPSE